MQIIIILIAYILFCILVFVTGRILFRKFFFKLNTKTHDFLKLSHILSLILVVIFAYLKTKTDYTFRGITTEWFIAFFFWLTCLVLYFNDITFSFLRAYFLLILIIGFLVFPVFLIASFTERNYYHDNQFRLVLEGSYMAQVHKIKLVKKGVFLEKEFKVFP